MRRILSPVPLLCLLLMQALPGTAPAETLDNTLQDAQRYLLLYSATGDERFLRRLERLVLRIGPRRHSRRAAGRKPGTGLT